MPHEHHSDVEDVQHAIENKEATSILDYLQLAFHVDMGGEHLENFKISNELSIPFPLICVEFSFSPLVIKPEQFLADTNTPTFVIPHSPREHFWNEASFRGPPTV